MFSISYEHWKTAGSALKRIRDAFVAQEFSPHTVFVAAAIAKKMAAEMWADLESGVLSNAANLTKANQVASVCGWLVNLNPRRPNGKKGGESPLPARLI